MISSRSLKYVFFRIKPLVRSFYVQYPFESIDEQFLPVKNDLNRRLPKRVLDSRELISTNIYAEFRDRQQFAFLFRLNVLVSGRNFYGQCGYVDNKIMVEEFQIPETDGNEKDNKDKIPISWDPYKKMVRYPRYPFKLGGKKKPVIVSASAGYQFSILMALDIKKHKIQRKLYVCGLNVDNQLGDVFSPDPFSDKSLTVQEEEYIKNFSNVRNQSSADIIPYFRQLKFHSLLNISQDLQPVDIAAGGSHTAVILNDQRGTNRTKPGEQRFRESVIIMTMGENTYGQCGVKSDNTDIFRTVDCKAKYNGNTWYPTSVQCGRNHTIVMSKNPRTLPQDGWAMFVFGRNEEGQLGIGGYQNAYNPVCVSTEVPLERVSTKKDFNVALDLNGDIWGWGCNQSGIFNSVTENAVIDKPTRLFENKIFPSKPVEIKAGDRAAIILCENGSVWVFGRGHLGYMPDQHELFSAIPLPIHQAWFNWKKAIKVEAGFNSFGVISESGELFTWGKNALNVGLRENRVQPFPFRVPIISKCYDLSLGFDHILVQNSQSNMLADYGIPENY